MTHEEFRHCVYNQYLIGSAENGISSGCGFRSPENCYEIINERRNTQPVNRKYSQYEHHYKIKW